MSNAFYLFSFPSSGQISGGWSILPLYTGPLALAIGVGLVVALLRDSRLAPQRERKTKEERLGRVILPFFCAIPFLIGGCHIYLGYRSLADGYALQFETQDVVSMEVRPYRYDESSRRFIDQNATVIELNDELLVQEGMDRLHAHRRFYGKHEHVIGGYLVHLRMCSQAGKANRYLSVHRSTSVNEDVFVVVPHSRPRRRNPYFESGQHSIIGGEYQCPAFYKWFEANVLNKTESADTASQPSAIE
jgi:hypothetical protein